MSGQISNDRTRTHWTPTMERYFIDLMLEQMHRGQRSGHTFSKQAWMDMLNVFNAKFGSQYDKDVLKSRYTNLWKQYNDVKALLNQSGFSWDESQQMVVAEEGVWTAYIKSHPDARPYKTKAVLSFNDLCLIYGYTAADGRYSRSSHDLEFDEELQGVNMGDGNGHLVPAAGDRPRTDWTPAMDQYFIELMLDQTGLGNKTESTFSKQSWNDMLALFNVKFGAQYGKRVLRHRHKKLWKYYTDINVILKQAGFSWDESRQMIVAADDFWDSYIKAHPHAKTYRMKALPNYNDLVIIFGTEVKEVILKQSGKEFEDDISVAKTDGKQNQMNGSDRSRTYWTPPMDRYLIGLLVDQVNRGNKVAQTFITQAWMNMVNAFNAKFGSNHDKDVLKNRYKHLRKLYNDIKHLLQQNGFWWDETKDMVIAEDTIWDAYVKAHPDARPYRVKTVPSYHKLCLIFGEESSRYTRLAQDIDSGSIEAAPMSGNGKDVDFGATIDSLTTEWTPFMDRYLVDLMLEQVYGGNKLGETFTEQAWAHMVESFNCKFGIQVDLYMLENRYIYLMKEHYDISNILNRDGFAWNENQQMLSANDATWEAYLQEQPDAVTYRGKFLGNYTDLCKIRGNVFQERFICDDLVIELDENSQEMEIDGGIFEQQRKRTDATISYPGHIVSKAQKTEQEMAKPFAETEGCSSSIASAIDALQAVPDIDEELLLDACDLLEDERKAKTFLALDVSLRKKWLLRKLRPSA